MQPFYVYILKCSNGSYYVGHTDDIEKRLEQHNAKDPSLASYVSKYLPVELVFVECMASRGEALDAEYRIKKWSRKKKEALIACNWDQVRALAKKKFR